MAKKTAPKKSGWQRIKRNAITVLVIGLILYIGAHVLSRLEGTRQMVADKLSNGTRQQISIEKCNMTPLLGLHIHNLAFQGVEMPDVKMSFNWFSFLSKETPFVKELRIKAMEIRFRRIPTTGNWEPLVLNGIGSRLGAVLGLNPTQMTGEQSLPKFPPNAINTKTLLQLERAKVVWKDENGRGNCLYHGSRLAPEIVLLRETQSNPNTLQLRASEARLGSCPPGISVGGFSSGRLTNHHRP